MSLAPEYVARLELIIAEHRATGRKLAQLALDVSQETAVIRGPCPRCADRGVIVGETADVQSVPCLCEKGRPFREALLQRQRREAAVQPSRYLPNDANKSGREKAAGSE